MSKADELNNAADPSEGVIGNVLYSLDEVYIHPEGIVQHIGAAGNWLDMGNFLELISGYGQVLSSNGEVIHTL